MSVEPAQIPKERYSKSFEKHLGVEFEKYQDSYCEVTLEIKDHHLNIGETVHGGIINALCDIALSGAVTSNFVDKAGTVVTLQMNVNFLKPGFSGDKLTAYGEVTKQGRTIFYVEGGVKNQNGELLARASGNWFVKRPHV